MKYLAIFCLFAFSACGYRVDNQEKISISVPYVIGDFEGELTDALISALSHTSELRYTTGDPDWILKTKIIGSINDRIGYRYDTNPKSGKLRTNIVGVENRKSITAEVTVVSAATGKNILGPQIVKAFADFDYVNPNSLQDVSFIDPTTGERASSIAFSLGQLDSVGAAGEDAIYPIYRSLARKIVDGIIATGGE